MLCYTNQIMRGYRYGKWEVREKEESFDGEERFYKPSFGIASFSAPIFIFLFNNRFSSIRKASW